MSDSENKENSTEPMAVEEENESSPKTPQNDTDIKKDEAEDSKETQEEIEEKSSPKPSSKPSSPKKTPKKEESEKKEKAKSKEDVTEGDEESEDEDEEEGEKKVGLFDQPLEVTGSRERKKVQRLDVSFSSPAEKHPEIQEGKGEKLGDCPRIEFNLQKNTSDELKFLHKLLFKRLGSGLEIKKNIRKFSGFPFEKDSDEYNKKKAALERPGLKLAVLKHVCEVLDLEKSGTKSEIITRILDFLIKPKPSGKKVPQPKKKASKTPAKRAKKGKKSTANEAASEDEENEEEEEEVANEQKNGDSKSEEEEEENDEVSEDEKPKKKKRAPKKKVEKKTPAKRKSTTQKKPRGSAKKAKTEVVESGGEEEPEEEEEDEAQDSDEALSKKSSKDPPSDDDIVALIKKILEGANLEEITMKKVIKEVFEKFPDHDLAEKKEFIKSTVRSLIS